MKKNCPSLAQARLLARLWGRQNTMAIPTVPDAYVDPTTVACEKRGWLRPNGEKGAYENGVPYASYVVSDDGLDAIETFFREQRYKRPETPRQGTKDGR